MEEEAEDQDDRREEGQQEVEGRMAENQNNTQHERMKMAHVWSAHHTPCSWANVNVTLKWVLAGARKCDVWGVLFTFTHTVGCSRLLSAAHDLTTTIFFLKKKQILSKYHSEQLSEKAASTSRPVLWSCSFHELRGNRHWWIYELHQESFHCHQDVLDEEDDLCHFWYCQKGIGASRSSPDSRWRRCIFVNASLKSDRSFIGAFLPDVFREKDQVFLKSLILLGR